MTSTFSAGITLSAVIPTNDPREREARLDFGYVAAEIASQRFGARLEVRGTEGRYRPFYEGAVWLEEGYGYVKTAAGEVRVGKLPTQLTLADETFAGNAFSALGLTRNPGWGAALSGQRRVGKYDELSWDAAFFGRNDRVSWEEDGLDLESDPAARLSSSAEARVRYLKYKGLFTLRPAVFLSRSSIDREAGPNVRRTDAGADLTVTAGPLSAAGGAIFRNASGASPGDRPGYRSARGWLATFQAEFPSVVFRYSYTRWALRDGTFAYGVHQPGVVWRPVRFLEATVEYLFQTRSVGLPRAREIHLGLTFAYP
ncbi:MAG: hypothetical protein JNK60_12400 [Acidobacteria bacterium]|nr:hypothetical protein [Acidobacteriota bacterium]